jgi:hypothetical protein
VNHLPQWPEGFRLGGEKMNAPSSRESSIRVLWGAALIRRVRPVVALALFAVAGQFRAESEKKPPCDIPPDSYAVLQSTLEYQDMSASYAESIYNDVRRVVRGYLADYYTEQCFYDSGLEVDAANHNRNTLLDLQCKVKRVSNKVILSVRIARHDTQESLLLFETSALFFQPAAALASFAAAFPELFAGRVVRHYSYAMPPQGFYLPRGALYIGMNLGNVSYIPEDLEKDLMGTENVPPGLIRSLRCFRIRRDIASTVGGLGAVTVLVTLLPLTIIGMLAEKDPDITVPPAIWITIGAGSLMCAIPFLESAIFRPRKLMATLNDWCCND